MAPAIGLMVVRIAAPCGLSVFGNAFRPWVSPVTQADTESANSVNIAVNITTCVSIRKNSHNTASDTTSITVAGKTTKRPPFLSNNLPNKGAATAWAILAGIRIRPVAVPVSINTCCVYIGTINSKPKNRNIAPAKITTQYLNCLYSNARRFNNGVAKRN